MTHKCANMCTYAHNFTIFLMENFLRKLIIYLLVFQIYYDNSLKHTYIHTQKLTWQRKLMVPFSEKILINLV